MHYPKNSFIIAMMALFLGLIIDILISNAISLEDNQKLLLILGLIIFFIGSLIAANTSNIIFVVIGRVYSFPIRGINFAWISAIV